MRVAPLEAYQPPATPSLKTNKNRIQCKPLLNSLQIFMNVMSAANRCLCAVVAAEHRRRCWRGFERRLAAVWSSEADAAWAQVVAPELEHSAIMTSVSTRHQQSCSHANTHHARGGRTRKRGRVEGRCVRVQLALLHVSEKNERRT